MPQNGSVGGLQPRQLERGPVPHMLDAVSVADLGAIAGAEPSRLGESGWSCAREFGQDQPAELRRGTRVPTNRLRRGAGLPLGAL